MKHWQPVGYGFIVDFESGIEYYSRKESVPGGHLRPGDNVKFDVVESHGGKTRAVNVRVAGWRETGDPFSDEIDMCNPNWAPQLAELAEKEEWNYQLHPTPDRFVILRSYLKYTYLRQRELSDHLVYSKR